MPQKRSLRQIEKQQRRRESDKRGERERVEKTIGSLDIPDVSGEELIDQIKRMKAITPTGIAIQFNIKVSVAKKLLEELRKDRVVDMLELSLADTEKSRYQLEDGSYRRVDKRGKEPVNVQMVLHEKAVMECRMAEEEMMGI